MKTEIRVQRRQSNNVNVQFKHELELLKVNISFITSNDFRRLCSFVCICLHLLKHNYRCFLILVQSLSACTFSRIVDCFHECKLSSVWSYIFLLNDLDKKAKQNNIHSNKKPNKFANESPSANEICFGAMSKGLCADWLV